MNISLDRRQFIKLIAATGAIAQTACSRPPPETILPYVHMPERMLPGAPEYYATAFVQHGYAIGVLIESNMGRPIKIEGNPHHPASRGATNTFAQASILQLWDPDRSRSVRRDGIVSTWSEWLSAISSISVEAQKNRGAGLRILTGNITSPTLLAQLQQLKIQFPNLHWHTYEPLHNDNASAGATLAFGKPLDVIYRIERANVIVTLDADFLSHGPAATIYAREFAARRRPDHAAGMNRVYALECSPGLLGTVADHRIPLSPAELERAAWQLAELIEGNTINDAPNWLQQIALDLNRHRGESLIIAGPRLPPSLHALAHSLNERLNNSQHTIQYIAPVVPPQNASLQELVSAMSDGGVDTLFILNNNAVYQAPAALEFSAALKHVRCSIHAGFYVDETARQCQWHVPLAHTYEQWSDARAYDGTATIVQPLIAPLYGGTSPHEILNRLLGNESRSAYDTVRAYWRSLRSENFDAFWQSVLQRGVIADSAFPSQTVVARPVEKSRALNDASLTAIFAADPAVDDGEYSNNGWLQELPRPLSAMTWDNAALMSVATARRYNVNNGDIVELQHNGRRLQTPVWIVPGHADRAITLPLGYGRWAAGNSGNGVGFNAYALRPVDSSWFIDGIQLRKLGTRYSFALTQTQTDSADRKPVLHATLTELRAQPEFVRIDTEKNSGAGSLYPEYSYDNYKWGMTIDLSACIGCNACTIACQAENNIPVVGKNEVARGRHMHWIRVDHYFEGSKEDESAQKNPTVLYQPVPCMHCERAPCEEVCPVGATMHDSEGLNVQVYNRCVGTRFCSNNCPYKVRRFNFLQYADRERESLKAQRNPEVTVRQRGVMEKCTYCLQRITRGRIEAEKRGTPLRDGEIVTACQAVCPTQAIAFGNLNDGDSAVARAQHSSRNYTLLEELNTKPRTTYLAKISNPNASISAQLSKPEPRDA
ncbi:MAG TPA: 4Fe-4S dicluster domain-containing protein [Spongiibacteraceae bacterium]|jgi:molybdopterin-containing oxidoreductase family iron-sulfur binding subunit